MKMERICYVVDPHGATHTIAEWALRVANLRKYRDRFLFVHPSSFPVVAQDLCDTHFVFWNGLPKNLHGAQRVSVVYAEAMGGAPLPEHVAHLERFKELEAPRAHAIIVHTPYMKSALAAHVSTPIVVSPVGWLPTTVHATPRDEVAFFGSAAGKRVWSVPHLHGAGAIVDYSGTFGVALDLRVAGAKFIVDLAHSNVHSTSTWRMWQTVALGAMPIVEMAGTPEAPQAPDLYPFPDDAYLTLPVVTRENLSQISDRLTSVFAEDIQSQQMLLRAKAAEYTFGECALRLLDKLNGVHL